MEATASGDRELSKIFDWVVLSPDCWLWTGRTSWKQYARTTVEGRDQYIHRVMYERFVGPIPEGMQIDHICRVKYCVNPAHLRVVTVIENLAGRRGKFAKARASREAA